MGQGALQREERTLSEATRVYTASRGGHAPGHLREALLDWLDRVMDSGMDVFDDLRSEGELNQVGGTAPDHPDEDLFYDGPKSLKWLIGQLWNCTDTLPGLAVSYLKEILETCLEPMPAISSYSSYGRAVRQIAEIVKLADTEEAG